MKITIEKITQKIKKIFGYGILVCLLGGGLSAFCTGKLKLDTKMWDVVQ